MVPASACLYPFQVPLHKSGPAYFTLEYTASHAYGATIQVELESQPNTKAELQGERLESPWNRASSGYPGKKKKNECSISIYVSFCSYLVQHPCHHISVTLMENIRDALLMSPHPPFRYTALALPLRRPPFLRTTQTITASDVSVSECVAVRVLCIWCSVTAQITAQCTSEHPVFKCQLSGRRTVTVLPQIRCLCDTMWLTTVYNKVTCRTSKYMDSGEWVGSNDLFCLWKAHPDLIWVIFQCIDLLTAQQIKLLMK